MEDIHIEFYNGIMYIGTDNSSGCEYEYKTKEDIMKGFIDYVNNYMEVR